MRERSECRSELNLELATVTVAAAGTPTIVMGNDEELEGGAIKDGDDSRRLPAVAAICCCGSSYCTMGGAELRMVTWPCSSADGALLPARSAARRVAKLVKVR